jgi:nascent polypeptide-associated complex subunit alpha
MMKKMGIEQTEVDGVREIIIRFAEKEWLITNPQVTMIRQPGGESFQISGTKTERGIESGPSLPGTVKTSGEREAEIPIEDAALVAGQTGVSIEKAMETLKETEGDLAAAILKLKHR